MESKKKILIIGAGIAAYQIAEMLNAQLIEPTILSLAIRQGKQADTEDYSRSKIKSIVGEDFEVWSDPHFTLKALQIGISVDKLKAFERDTDFFLDTGNIELDRLKELILEGHRKVSFRKEYKIELPKLEPLRHIELNQKVDHFATKNLGAKIGGRKHKKNPFKYRR